MLALDLTRQQHAVLRDAFAPFAGSFERVCVFGSRADGTALPGSDVDLVVYGADERTIGDIRLAIDESDLSIFADVVRFEGISDARFASVVARQARLLFTPADL